MLRKLITNSSMLALIASGCSGCSDGHSPEEMAVSGTSAKIQLLCDALLIEYGRSGAFPDDQVEFTQSITQGPDALLRSSVLTDEWGRMVNYQKTQDSATISSTAEDVSDPEDDISCSLKVEEAKGFVTRTSNNVFGRKIEVQQERLGAD
jgi:hypothetical protein